MEMGTCQLGKDTIGNSTVIKLLAINF